MLFINTLGILMLKKKKKTHKIKMRPLLIVQGLAVLLGRLVTKSCQPLFS